ncbi:MAG: hypothetical protein J5666_03645 [Bacilli bacterium]|nr:hypothetical protein [Bacilli bacterium]
MNSLFNLPILTIDNQMLLIILFIVAGLVVIIGIVLLVYFLVHRKKGQKVIIDNNVWFLALGNKENIKEISGVGSRLTIKLVDKDKIDREKLKELGVSSVLVMSNKVTLVVEGQAEKLSEVLNANL